jgi:hypothetical protein
VFGYELWDLGGDGDCAYRAAAAASAVLMGKTAAEVEKGKVRGGARLRMETTALIRQHELFKGAWVPDDETTERLEGGPVPGDWAEWVSATARDKRYACEHTLAVMAAKLERRLVVFAWHPGQGKWIKGWVINPPEELSKKRQKVMLRGPIPLLLRDQHYVTLRLGSGEGQGEEDWPMAWADAPDKADVALLAAVSLRGAGGSVASDAVSDWFPAEEEASAAGSVQGWFPSSAAGSAAGSVQGWWPASAGGSSVGTNGRKRLRSKAPPSSLWVAESDVGRLEDLEEAMPPPPPPAPPVGDGRPRGRAVGPMGGKSKPSWWEEAGRKWGSAAAYHAGRQKLGLTWNCPVPDCGFTATDKWQPSLQRKRNRHVQKAHPEMPRETFYTRQRTPVTEPRDPAVVKAELGIPVDQPLPREMAAWHCGTCGKVLPLMSTYEIRKSAREHHQAAHGSTYSSTTEWRERVAANGGRLLRRRPAAAPAAEAPAAAAAAGGGEEA